MKNAKLFAWVLFLLSLLVGCGDHDAKFSAPKFKIITSAKFQLLTGEQTWGGVSSIYRYHDIIVVMMYDLKRPSAYLHFFDLSGNLLCDMIYNGRGPYETQSTPRTYMRDSILYLQDIIGQKMLAVNLAEVQEEGYGACEYLDMNVDFLCIYAEKLMSGDTLRIFRPGPSSVAADDARIILTSQNGSFSYMESPYADLSRGERGYFEFSTSKRTVAPDGRHFAISIGNGAILETFEILDRRIYSVSTKYFIEPKYDVSPTSVGINDESVAGFGYPYSTNEHIYTVYDGENTYNDETKMLFKNIAVFDWKGNALKEIRTDYRISSIYTDDGKEFYAVVEDKDRRPYVARLVVE